MEKILFVDDESGILKLLEESFSSYGYDVYTAQSGEEALEILKVESMSVIVTDIRMPGMSGIELCHKIREYNKISVVIAMSGYCSFGELTDCRSTGFDDYLKKPFESQEMKQIVEFSLARVQRWKELFRPYTYEENDDV